MTDKQIVEINGIKMEVDMRHAVRIDKFKIGDPVKILITSDNSVKAGVIVGFENFQSLPTIVVAYLKSDYWTTGIDFAYLNTKSSDKYELVASDENTLMSVDKSAIVSRMDDEITKKELEVEEMRRKKRFFLERFGVYFGATEHA